MRPRFSVRAKILLAIVVSIVALSIAMYVIATQVLLKSYLRIETDEVAQNLQRAQGAIEDFASQQNIKERDWAQWDETYTFAADQNEVYTQEYAIASALANLDIHLFAVATPEGEIIFARAVELPSDTEIAPESITTPLSAYKTVFTHPTLESSVWGIVMLGDTPLVVASVPITTTEGLGPTTGTLIFGRFLDETKITEIAEVTHLALSVFPYNAENLPDYVTVAKKQLSTHEHYITALSDKAIAGYALIKDIDGNPALIIRIETPRPIYNQGILTFSLFTGIGAIALLAFGIIMILLLEQLVISRFVRLGKEVNKISETQDLTLRVNADVKDDVGTLAGTFNQFLEKLAVSLAEQKKSRQEIVTLLEDIAEEKKLVEEKVVLRTQQLRDEKARLIASINSLSFGFIIADSTDQIVVSNPALLAALALSKVPQSVRDLGSIFRNAGATFDPVTLVRSAIEKKEELEEQSVAYGQKKLRVMCAPIFAGDGTQKTNAIGYVLVIEEVRGA